MRERQGFLKHVKLLIGLLALVSLPSSSSVQQEEAKHMSLAYAGQAGADAWYFLHLDLGPTWQTTITLSNLEDQPIQVNLSAYDEEGGFFGEVPAIRRLEAEAIQMLEAETVLPPGSETLKLESSGHLVASAIFNTWDRTKSEAIPAVQDASQHLVFPPLLQGDSDDKTITLLNIDSASANLEIIALDETGAELQRTLLPPLSPMASRTFAVKDLFGSKTLQQLATIRVISNRGIVGLQLVDPPTGDLVGLPALSSTSREWSFPIVTTGGNVELWTAVGLFNPGDVPSSVTVEAFDDANNSMGIIDGATLLPGATHFVITANMGGIVPPQAASLKVTADQPIGGYEVIGVKGGMGVTATLGIPAEDQTRVGLELTGSKDGKVLTVSPVVRMADGSLRSTVGAMRAGEWRERLLTMAVESPEAESMAVGPTTDLHQVQSQTSFSPSPAFVAPVDNMRIIQRYANFRGDIGKYHAGIDADHGVVEYTYRTSVKAAGSGIVHKIFGINGLANNLRRWDPQTGSYTWEPAPTRPPSGSNHGLGITVIIYHPSLQLYTLYGHLDAVVKGLAVGQSVVSGQLIGRMGNSYQQYLRYCPTGDGIVCPIPPDAPSGTVVDADNGFIPHVHFEVKDRGVLGNGRANYDDCDPLVDCHWGYMPTHPNWWGYHDPEIFLDLAVQMLSEPLPLEVMAFPLNVRDYPSTAPGSSIITRIVARTDERLPAFVALRNVGNEWYQIHLPNAPEEGWSASGWVAGTLGGTTYTRINPTLPQVEVIPEWARVRSQPSPTSPTLVHVYGGGFANPYNPQRFVPFEFISGWHRIYLPEKSSQPDGWISSSDVRLIGQPQPVLEVTPASLDFGQVPVGQSKDLAFTVKNIGGGTLTGSASASPDPPFRCVGGCSFSLGAGQSQQATFRFSPGAPQPYTGTASFTSNGGNASRPLTGQGVADIVTIRTAVFFNSRSLLFVSASSTAAPDAKLSLTVPGCVTDAPMTLRGRLYVFFTRACTGLDGQAATVTSSFGGSAEAVIR